MRTSQAKTRSEPSGGGARLLQQVNGASLAHESGESLRLGAGGSPPERGELVMATAFILVGGRGAAR